MTIDEPRACIVCHHTGLGDGERQAHADCVTRVRWDLIAVEQMYALLPVAMAARAGAAAPLEPSGVRSDDEPIPGGDALVLLAVGSNGGAQARAILADQAAEHADDEYASDPPSVLQTLASWEDDWRSPDVLDLPVRDHATVSGCAVFLHRGLSYMAQNHAAFDEFARDIHQLRKTLEQATKSGYPRDRAAIACPKCGGRLRKRYVKPDADEVPHPKRTKVLVTKGGKEFWEWQPDWDTHRRRVMAWNRRRMTLDQGGAREGWECGNRACGHSLAEAEYHLQVSSKMQAEALPVRDLALLLGVTGSRVRQIVSKHGIEPTAKNGKAPLYRVAEVMQHARPDGQLAS